MLCVRNRAVSQVFCESRFFFLLLVFDSPIRAVLFFYFRALQQRSFSLCFFFLLFSFFLFLFASIPPVSRVYIGQSLDRRDHDSRNDTVHDNDDDDTNANSERVSVPDVSVSRLPLSFFFSFHRVGAA